MVETLMQKQYQQYQMAKESIDIINRKYHDFKHQIEVLRSAQDFDIRNQYLDQLEEDISAYEAQNRTGCAVLDTILTSKSIACAGKNIKFTKVVDGSLISFMDTMDICSIFGNALENAIEYTETIDREKRLIHLSVSSQKEFVLIQVENYFEGELRFQDALPVTGKADKAFHGYGMKSMRSTAEKYGGSMTSAVNGTWFEVRILLPVPEEKTEPGKQPR